VTGLPDGLSIGELRRELRYLVAMAETGERPRPTRTNPSDHPMPGHEWVIEEERAPYTQRRYVWTIRAVDDPDHTDAVFISPADSSYAGEDFTPVTTTDARRIALALLAAADRADHLAAGVPRLADHRPTTEETDRP